MSGEQPSLSQSLLLQALEQISALDTKIGVVQGQNNLIIAEQKSAAEGRRLMYEKINRIDVLEAAVHRIAPLVDKHEEKHNQAAGAMWLGKTLWALGAGAAGALLASIAGKFGLGPPHP
jgi:hypothetical protein